MFDEGFDGKEFGREIVKAVRSHPDPLFERVATLEQKMARLEAAVEAKNFAYMGIWRKGKTYNAGAFVTDPGAIWHCNQFHTTTRRGDGEAAWTLAVKAGRDGKDAAA